MGDNPEENGSPKAKIERKIKRRPVKLVVGKEIEAMVESMFLEEACG